MKTKTCIVRPVLPFRDAAKLFSVDAKAGGGFLDFPSYTQQMNDEPLTAYVKNIPTSVELCKASLLNQPRVAVSYLKDASSLAELQLGCLLVSSCKVTQFLAGSVKISQPVYSFSRASSRFVM